MIIDFHTHIFPPSIRDGREAFFPDEPGFELLYHGRDAKLVSVEELIPAMDEAGVQRAVVFGFPWETADHYTRHNDYVLECVQRYPGRLIGFSAFSPLSPLALKEAERCLEAGLRGVGELAVYHTDQLTGLKGPIEDLARLCREREVPILLHVNEPVGHAYPGKTTTPLGTYYDLMKENPANRFVLAHWGGGLFFYALMKKEVKEVLRNTWFDTAASPFLYTPQIYSIASRIIGPDRILFGSDYPLLNPSRYFAEMETTGLSKEDRLRITGLNALQVLGLTA